MEKHTNDHINIYIKDENFKNQEKEHLKKLVSDSIKKLSSKSPTYNIGEVQNSQEKEKEDIVKDIIRALTTKNYLVLAEGNASKEDGNQLSYNPFFEEIKSFYEENKSRKIYPANVMFFHDSTELAKNDEELKKMGMKIFLKPIKLNDFTAHLEKISQLDAKSTNEIYTEQDNETDEGARVENPTFRPLNNPRKRL